MDLRMYYQKVRELERSFKTTFPVVVSQETPDGGTAGVKTEVPIHVAARMIVDGQAVLASEKEAQEFLEQKIEKRDRHGSLPLLRFVGVVGLSTLTYEKAAVHARQ